MSDLPDWVTAQANQGTVLFLGPKAAGSNYSQDVTNNQSLYIRFDGSVANTPLVMQIVWYTDSTLATPTQTQIFTCVANPGGGNDLVIETPVYSGYVRVTNQSTQIVTMTVIGTARNVSNIRVLEDAYPSRHFSYTTAVTAGTGVFPVADDFGPNDFVSNGQTTVVMHADVAGIFIAEYINIAGSVQVVFFGPVGAGATVVETLALPRGGIAFIFLPNANSAAPNIDIYATAAQL